MSAPEQAVEAAPANVTEDVLDEATEPATAPSQVSDQTTDLTNSPEEALAETTDVVDVTAAPEETLDATASDPVNTVTDVASARTGARRGDGYRDDSAGNTRERRTHKHAGQRCERRN